MMQPFHPVSAVLFIVHDVAVHHAQHTILHHSGARQEMLHGDRNAGAFTQMHVIVRGFACLACVATPSINHCEKEKGMCVCWYVGMCVF